MSQKSYFLAPSIDFAPDGLIKPGQIVSSLKTPHIAIGNPVPPPILHSGYLENWEDERRRSVSGSIGIFTQFLANFLGLGGDVAGNIEREDSTIWRFRRLDTYFVVPDKAYIEVSMSEPGVKKFFEEHPDTASYMITGVKIARGAELIRSRRRVLGADGQFGIDATTAGVPVSGGPTGSIARETVESSVGNNMKKYILGNMRGSKYNRDMKLFISYRRNMGLLYHISLEIYCQYEDINLKKLQFS
ncbi:hypothetical protein BDZ45DRAFT_693909 [Acephala macrosclerotiorum]|nr:hypothetical protein BDZ45DRAFT_693909 [Acephala macrosclerotiorum]